MTWTLNTDGGSRGNPGAAGLGFSLACDGSVVREGGWYIGSATNNVAEYSALIWGLENALALGVGELAVSADSELMVRQMTGAYKVRNAELKKLYARAVSLASQFSSITFTHVRRAHNSAADRMANEAMDARAPVGTWEVAFEVDSSDAPESPDVPDVIGLPDAPVAPDVPAVTDDSVDPAASAPADAPEPLPPSTSDAPSGTVLVGVTGGIAAYKTCELVRILKRTSPSIDVKVVMTEHATSFVGPATFRALTGNEVATGLFDAPGAPIHHISLAEEADVVCIAPATADVIAKLAGGIADDLLATTVLATDAPIVLAPAMNSAMWADAATQASVERCRELGMTVVGPDTGELACGEMGEGRMSPPDDIAAEVLALLSRGASLCGTRILVTAGPTHEAIDPVRYIANKSSGRQGFAIAAEAASRGSEVTLVTGPTALVAPKGVTTVRIESADEMLAACEEPFERCDAAVFVAAVADWRAASPSDVKLKSDGSPMLLDLECTPDIAATLASRKGGRHVTVFAAETGDPRPAAREKLEKKNADLVVCNDVSEEGAGFSSPDNHVWLVTADAERELSPRPKRAVASAVLDVIARAIL